MKVKFKTQAEIDEQFRDKAVQEGDEWVVDVGGILAKNTELLTENKKYKTTVDKVKDLDPDKARAALKEMATLDEQKAALDGRVQSALQEQAAKHATEMTKLQTQLTGITGEYESTLIRSELGPVVRSAKGIEQFVMPALVNRVKVVTENGKRVVRVIDDKGNPALDEKGQAKTVAALVEDFKKDSIYAKAFEAPAAGGSGAAPGAGAGGGQGGGATQFQLTETQARDRSTYTRVAAEAAKAGQSVQVIPG